MTAEVEVTAPAPEFGHDALGAMMAKYDKNGDGTFQIHECAAARCLPAARLTVLPAAATSPSHQPPTCRDSPTRLQAPPHTAVPTRRLTGCARSCMT